jgi:phosphopantothenoylcysteine decarboxylase / phosphopantothenate---cysteine ligase
MVDPISDKRILLGVSGSIAAYKAVELVRLLQKRGAKVQVAMTESALRFLTPLSFEALTKRRVLTNLFDVSGSEIEHVERAHEVDAMLIAPATANVIAKLAAGLADDVLSATALATRAPILIAPAMESGMWSNPITRKNVADLARRGVSFVGPEEGDLASGREGIGRLAELERIVAAAGDLFEGRARKDFSGVRMIVTAGPTFERLDPVRVLTNRSTGEMGIAIAAAAARRGAAVTLLLGPTHLDAPAEVRTVHVESAEEMLAAGEQVIDQADVLVAAAAVSDFRPALSSDTKLKRSDPRATQLALVENPDVLATLGARMKKRSSRGVVVGFAAETDAVEDNARQKLTKKSCDLVIGNRVGGGVGFGPGETEVIAVRSGLRAVKFGPAPKARVAEFVLDQVGQLLGQQEIG